MRSLCRLASVLLLVAGVVGCDSDQPLQVESQMVSITVGSVNGQSPPFDVWDMQEDVDQDGVGDGASFLWCQTAPGNPSPLNTTSVPWGFAAEVKIIPAGQTQARRVTTGLALQGSFNTTTYDTTVVSNLTLTKPPVVEQGRRFLFTNPRRLSRANRLVLQTTSNPLSKLNPMTYGYANGLCSLFDPGPAALDQQELPYTVRLGKGDTILVNLAKGPAKPGLVDDLGAPIITGNTAISAAMFLDGLEVVPNGDTTSGTEDGSVISFTYTSR